MSSKITFEMVKAEVEKNKAITDRGDLVRAVATALKTNYGVVYLKVRKAEGEIGHTTTSRKGRRPNAAKTEKRDVRRVKDGHIVAKAVTEAEANVLIEQAKKAKKAKLEMVPVS